MRNRDWMAWCGILTTALAALLLSACDLFTSPDLEGERFSACADYPAVYIALAFSAGQAEDFYHEHLIPLTTGPTGEKLLREKAETDQRITFFKPGEVLIYVRRSTRYDELVQVRTETDQLVTLRDELQGLVGPC